MKLRYIYSILLFTVIGFIALTAFVFDETEGNSGSKSHQNKIKFSHKVHSELTDCQSCHSKAVESKTLDESLYPDHDNCAQCHDVEDSNNCNMCHVNENYEAIHEGKSELIFNHQFHVKDKALACEHCHVGINDVAYASESAKAHPPMELCNSCHNNFNGTATNQCEACHKSTAGLKPQDHQKVNFIKTHKFAAMAQGANCVMCHDNPSCQDCHVATNVLTEVNLSTDFYAPFAPHNFVDGAKQQKITRVHDLNYRFVHGMDVKGKTMECQSCHQIETFCAECHSSMGGDFAMAGIRPASHDQPNFKTIGVGTGGGEHAILAKRDLENCASCHDVQGGDPTCITCHLDSDGIQGTNPKTHVRNFMHDVKGDWHESQGSICYNCHVSASPDSPAGTGFCGYCHGAQTE